MGLVAGPRESVAEEVSDGEAVGWIQEGRVTIAAAMADCRHELRENFGTGLGWVIWGKDAANATHLWSLASDAFGKS